MKVIVIGAGAAGLAIGWRLVQAGAKVVVLERAQPGRGATWASAGMISVVGEDGGQNKSEAALARRSGALWPQFAAEIEEGSGRRIGFRVDGKLAIAESATDLDRLSEVAHAASVAGGKPSMISVAAAREMEPMLRADIAGALWDPTEAQVDNRVLGVALAAAFLNAGGTLLATEAVVRLEMKDSRVHCARTPFALHEADVFVLAAGAWTGQIEGLPHEIVPPVFPVKGEMIALTPPARARLPQRIVGAHDAYLVPRHDRLFLGATVAREGFDTSSTDAAAEILRTGAARLMPAVAEWKIVEQWAGLRPGSPDDLPILGATAADGLFVASGQFRNGILFTPAIAEALCNLILKRRDEPDLAAFDPRRFASAKSAQ